MRRMIAFGFLPVLGAVSPLVALPILARAVSTEQWVAIAIGQSIGAMAALALGCGYTIVGAPQIAVTEPDSRPRALLRSLGVRLAAFVILGPLASAFALVGGGPDPLLSATVAVSTMLIGFGVGWYAVGSMRPSVMAYAETLPRVASNLTGAIAVWVTRDAYMFAVVSSLVLVSSYATFYGKETGYRFEGRWVRSSFRTLPSRASSAGTEFAAGVYTNGASAIVGSVGSVAAVASFNSGYRLTYYGAVAFTALANSLQGWIAGVKGVDYFGRLRIGAWIHLALGAAGFAGFALLGPWATRLMFGDHLGAGTSVMAWLGFYYFIWSFEVVTARYILAVQGRVTVLVITTCMGSLTGVIGLIALVPSLGAVGGAIAVTAGVSVIVGLQAGMGISQLRRRTPGLESRG